MEASRSRPLCWLTLCPVRLIFPFTATATLLRLSPQRFFISKFKVTLDTLQTLQVMRNSIILGPKKMFEHYHKLGGSLKIYFGSSNGFCRKSELQLCYFVHGCSFTTWTLISVYRQREILSVMRGKLAFHSHRAWAYTTVHHEVWLNVHSYLTWLDVALVRGFTAKITLY